MSNIQKFQFPKLSMQTHVTAVAIQNNDSLNVKTEDTSSGSNSGPICGICLKVLEASEPITATQCMHPFHSECLQEWVDTKPNCPICKRVVRKSELNWNNDIIIKQETSNNNNTIDITGSDNNSIPENNNINIISDNNNNSSSNDNNHSSSNNNNNSSNNNNNSSSNNNNSSSNNNNHNSNNSNNLMPNTHSENSNNDRSMDTFSFDGSIIPGIGIISGGMEVVGSNIPYEIDNIGGQFLVVNDKLLPIIPFVSVNRQYLKVILSGKNYRAQMMIDVTDGCTPNDLKRLIYFEHKEAEDERELRLRKAKVEIRHSEKIKGHRVKQWDLSKCVFDFSSDKYEFYGPNSKKSGAVLFVTEFYLGPSDDEKHKENERRKRQVIKEEQQRINTIRRENRMNHQIKLQELKNVSKNKKNDEIKNGQMVKRKMATIRSAMAKSRKKFSERGIIKVANDWVKHPQWNINKVFEELATFDMKSSQRELEDFRRRNNSNNNQKNYSKYLESSERRYNNFKKQAYQSSYDVNIEENNGYNTSNNNNNSNLSNNNNNSNLYLTHNSTNEYSGNPKEEIVLDNPNVWHMAPSNSNNNNNRPRNNNNGSFNNNRHSNNNRRNSSQSNNSSNSNNKLHSDPEYQRYIRYRNNNNNENIRHNASESRNNGYFNNAPESHNNTYNSGGYNGPNYSNNNSDEYNRPNSSQYNRYNTSKNRYNNRYNSSQNNNNFGPKSPFQTK